MEQRSAHRKCSGKCKICLLSRPLCRRESRGSERHNGCFPRASGGRWWQSGDSVPDLLSLCAEWWFQPPLRNAPDEESRVVSHVPFSGLTSCSEKPGSTLGGWLGLTRPRSPCLCRAHFHASQPSPSLLLRPCFPASSCLGYQWYEALDVGVARRCPSGLRIAFMFNTRQRRWMQREARGVVIPGRRHVRASGVQETFCLLIRERPWCRGIGPALTIWARFCADALLHRAERKGAWAEQRALGESGGGNRRALLTSPEPRGPLGGREQGCESCAHETPSSLARRRPPP